MRLLIAFVMLTPGILPAHQGCGTYLFHDEAVLLDSLWGHGPTAWTRAGESPPRAEYEVGDSRRFYTSIGTRWLQATLRVKGEHCYLWAEDALWGSTITMSKLQVMRTMFDDSTLVDPTRGIYEIVVEAFGPPPDIDNDHRIHILVLDIGASGVGGYFSPTNEYPSSVYPTSNELDMFYYDDNLDPRTSDFAASVPAHELQHMINWNQDPNEELWINEGCSGLAERLVGYLNAGGWAATWAQHTDASLTNWDPNEGDYFGTALFAIYLYDCFGGSSFTRALLAEPANGIIGIEYTLAASGFPLDFAGVFTRWVVANLVDDPSPSFYGGVYGYELIDLPVSPSFSQDYGTYPVPPTSDQVAVWGADYLRLRDGALMRWAFTGPHDQWRRLHVMHVRLPSSQGLAEVHDRGVVVDTLRVDLDGFGVDWAQEVAIGCNTSKVDLTLTHWNFTTAHPAASPSLAGWPVSGLGLLASSPAAHDGLLALADRDGALHLLTGSGAPLPNWPVRLQDQVWATPTIADLDRDGSPEVIVGTRGAKIHVLGIDGQEALGWPVSLPPSPYGLPSPIASSDIDGDGLPDVVAASFSGDLVCLRADGTPLPGWPVSWTAPFYSSPAAGDVDADGVREIAAASMDSLLHLFDAGGQERPGWPVRLHGRSWGGVAMGVLGDGVPAVVATDEAGWVSAFFASGDPVPGWPVFVGSRIQAPAALGDLDGDGTAEVVVATLGGVVTVLRGNGAPLQGWPRSTGAEVWGSPVVADLDGDGRPEIALASKQGKVSVFEPSGASVPGWPLLLGQQVQAGPAATDLDGDGTVELIVPGLQGLVQAWDLECAVLPDDEWPQTGRDATHTSALLRPGSSAGRSPLPRLFLSVAPVPARGEATVWVRGTEGTVVLDVYDLSGARIERRVITGTTRVGATLPSGLYLLRVTDGPRTVSAPLIVVR